MKTSLGKNTSLNQMRHLGHLGYQNTLLVQKFHFAKCATLPNSTLHKINHFAKCGTLLNVLFGQSREFARVRHLAKFVTCPSTSHRQKQKSEKNVVLGTLFLIFVLFSIF